jgi:hypothetical protein
MERARDTEWWVIYVVIMLENSWVQHVITVCRKKWAEHVERMPDNRIPKLLYRLCIENVSDIG